MSQREEMTRETDTCARTVSGRAGGTNNLSGQTLIARVRQHWGEVIQEACRNSSVPSEFLGALVASESAGKPDAARFEPRVYRHLVRVAEGRSPRYGSLTRPRIEAEVADILSLKSPAYHEAFFASRNAPAHGARLAQSTDESLRELATSWGLTQIMGYHMAGRAGVPRDLLEPRFHFRVALELLAEFAERYELNLARDFEEMFRCWNTGQPYGATSDPAYVENGLRRIKRYHCIME